MNIFIPLAKKGQGLLNDDLPQIHMTKKIDELPFNEHRDKCNSLISSETAVFSPLGNNNVINQLTN